MVAAAKIEDALQTAAKLRQMHAMVMVDDAHQIATDARRAVRAHQAGYLGLDPQKEADREGATVDDDMGTHFHIGDTHATTTATNEPPKSGLLDTFAKAAIVGGMTAMGLGVPAAIFSLPSLLRPTPIVQPTPTPTTNGVQYDLEIVK